MKLIQMSLLASTVVLFTACGSSDSTTVTPETVTGQFVDTYVAGLNYTCSSGTTDVTNNLGEYTCNVGDTVEFSLGGYVLGSVAASSGIVTPESLYPDNAEAALNVAQVIQSLDADPTDDIITIPENFTALDDVTTTPTDVNFDALIEDVLDVPLVTEEEAQAHLDETELMLLLAGKTFYTVGSDWMDRLVFNADLTESTWEQIKGSSVGETGTDTLEVAGEKLIITGDEGVFSVVVAEVTTDYILVNAFDSEGTADGQDKLYFDQAKAEAYYDSLQPDLEALIVDKTIYFATSLGVIGDRQYSADGSYTGNLVLADGTPLAVSGTYEIEGIVLTITRTNPNAATIILTYVGEEAGGSAFTGTVNAGEVFETVSFETEAERDAFVASLQPDLEALIVEKTRYFVNSQGVTGYRNLAADGSYTGNIVTADGKAFDVSGTYEIVGNVLTINRTSPSSTTLILTYTGEEAGGLGFTITVDGGEEFQAISFATEAERDAYPILDVLIVGKTKYFANSQGVIGHRIYAADGSYTGDFISAGGGTVDVNGTYEIVGNILTINRISPSSTTLILTYVGKEVGGLAFTITVDGGDAFQTFSFATAAERDAYVASLLP